jgi:hypothetical protein
MVYHVLSYLIQKDKKEKEKGRVTMWKYLTRNPSFKSVEEPS